TASVTQTFATVGNYPLTASYNGDTNNLASTSSPLTLTVSIEPQVYYIHTDHLDTPRTITDASGTVVWQWDNTDPFGANVPNENPGGAGQFTFNLRFAGQYADRETGLHYNFHRDGYNPAIGAYTQFDPIGLGGGINGYVYAFNNPLSYVDPLGLEPANGRGFSTHYGNWCGKHWSGGESGPNIPSNPSLPADSLDNCCKTHDYCYAKLANSKCPLSEEDKRKEFKKCDEALASCSRALSNNGQNWLFPPHNTTDAYFYKQKLQFVFKPNESRK
ncbi:MAG TPA: RHS repeat-associated core domain-containing protein, partial [Gallionella sp.]|nr:RHS repeat-associated core domain-containing protein [Gallionella sp.]